MCFDKKENYQFEIVNQVHFSESKIFTDEYGQEQEKTNSSEEMKTISFLYKDHSEVPWAIKVCQNFNNNGWIAKTKNSYVYEVADFLTDKYSIRHLKEMIKNIRTNNINNFKVNKVLKMHTDDSLLEESFNGRI